MQWKDIGVSVIDVMEGNQSKNPPGMCITHKGHRYTRDLYFPPKGIPPQMLHQAIQWILTLRSLQECQTKKTKVAKQLDWTWWGTMLSNLFCVHFMQDKDMDDLQGH